MTGIIIVVHAPLGEAMREFAVHVLGDAGNNMVVHDILASDMPEDLAPIVTRDICRADKGDGVLVLTDLIGATPANIARLAVTNAQALGTQCYVVAGLNTSMLLRALTSRNQGLEQVRSKALAGGVQGCLQVD